MPLEEATVYVRLHDSNKGFRSLIVGLVRGVGSAAYETEQHSVAVPVHGTLKGPFGGRPQDPTNATALALSTGPALESAVSFRSRGGAAALSAILGPQLRLFDSHAPPTSVFAEVGGAVVSMGTCLPPDDM